MRFIFIFTTILLLLYYIYIEYCILYLWNKDIRHSRAEAEIQIQLSTERGFLYMPSNSRHEAHTFNCELTQYLFVCSDGTRTTNSCVWAFRWRRSYQMSYPNRLWGPILFNIHGRGSGLYLMFNYYVWYLYIVHPAERPSLCPEDRRCSDKLMTRTRILCKKCMQLR